jgi:hypothetical protein
MPEVSSEMGRQKYARSAITDGDMLRIDGRSLVCAPTGMH